MRSRIGVWSAVLFSVVLSAHAQAKEAASAPSPPNREPTSSTAYVFVPYDRAAGPAFGKDQSVLLPYAEFLRLKDTTKSAPDRPDFRPGAALSQATYAGTIETNVATLDAEFVVEVLARPKDTLVVRLPFGNAAVEKANVDGSGASIAPLEDATGLAVTMTGEGRRTVKLRLAVPLGSDGAIKRLDFHTPRAAAASLKLRVPDDVVLEIIPDALPATVAKAAGGRRGDNRFGGKQRPFHSGMAPARRSQSLRRGGPLLGDAGHEHRPVQPFGKRPRHHEDDIPRRKPDLFRVRSAPGSATSRRVRILRKGLVAARSRPPRYRGAGA